MTTAQSGRRPAARRATRIQPPTVAERAALGRAARRDAPRSAHAEWQRPAGADDPLTILERQAEGRVPGLVPIRHERMRTSPFAFFRGAAAIMAADLAGSPVSGLTVQACGDAHLANFGGFAAPDRRLVFDLNDFDETLRAPWEWDVKRLTASIAVAGRHRGIGRARRREIVAAAVAAYRGTMSSLAGMRDIEVWYARTEVEPLLRDVRGRVSGAVAARARRRIERARGKDSLRALRQLTMSEGADEAGDPRIVSDPPLLVPLAELALGADADAVMEHLQEVFETYRSSLRDDVRRLMSGYRLVDLARKVSGVGSVGLRSWVLLLVGRDRRDPLFLQAKEANPSVLEPYAERSRYDHDGRRVVEGQRLMQAASDIVLGWVRVVNDQTAGRDFYVRQLWDAKASVDLETIEPQTLRLYGELCGATLARAHARTGDRIAIASYLGAGPRLDRALAEFAEAYADQTHRDHAAFVAAIRAGRIAATADA